MSARRNNYENEYNERDKAFMELNKRKMAKEKKRRKAAAMLKFMQAFVLALFGVVLFAAVMVFALSRDFSKSPDKLNFTLSTLIDGKKHAVNDFSVYENECYFSLGDFSQQLGYKIVGDVNVMTAAFDNGDRVRFNIGTDIVEINGNKKFLGHNIYFSAKDANVYVPVEFFENTFDGIVLNISKNGKKIDYTIEFSNEEKILKSTGNLPTYPLDKSLYVLQASPESDFLADLSAYEMYMNPEDSEEYIRLINIAHPLGADYVPGDLCGVVDTRNDRAQQKMREYAAKALEAMFIEMRANGYTDVSVTSAYRSYDYQSQLFNNSLNSFRQYYDYNTAYAKTAAQIAIPGTSEHQSGLCADLHNLPAASQQFESKDVYKWLVSHCADFGFILRYPKDKSDITGIIFEPWHYRYVGRYYAQKIMKSGLCLEEFCEQNGVGI